MATRKKLGNSIKSLRETTVTGMFNGVRQLTDLEGNPVLSKAYETQLFVMDLTDVKTKELTSFWADAGLRGTLKLCQVKDGMILEITHTGEKKIDSGTVQTYDIFELTV